MVLHSSSKPLKDEGQSPKIKDCPSDLRTVGAYVSFSHFNSPLTQGPCQRPPHPRRLEIMWHGANNWREKIPRAAIASMHAAAAASVEKQI